MCVYIVKLNFSYNRSKNVLKIKFFPILILKIKS